MTHVKTAISLPKLLFERAESVAEEMKITPSHLMALALEEFISRRQNQQLLEKINAACAETPDREEQALRRSLIKQHRQIVGGEWELIKVTYSGRIKAGNRTSRYGV